MKQKAFATIVIAATFCLGFALSSFMDKQPGAAQQQSIKPNNIKLGAFSISLNVKDLSASKQFYENLGFTVSGGAMEKNYLIMKNGKTLIGIFKGMFQGNMLTFNPGWNEEAKNVDPFDDVREIQKQLKASGIKLTAEADEKTTGPAYIMTADPDGNAILIDQHR